MNGFTLMKQSYQALMSKGVICEREARKEIRVYEFLEACDLEEICMMVDSGAFNDIIRGYCDIAIVQGSTNGIFDLFNASDVLKM